MRWLTVLAWVALAAPAAAKPKVAIAPLDNDADGAVTDAVADVAGDHAKVTSGKQVSRAMVQLKLNNAHTAKAVKKLRTRLEVDAVIHGRVSGSGGKKKVELTVAGKNGKTETVEIKFKSAGSKPFHKELRVQLNKSLDAVVEEEEEVVVKRDKKKKKDKDKGEEDDDKDKKDKRIGTRRSTEEEDTGGGGDDEEDRPRKKKKDSFADDKRPLTQKSVWVNGGGEYVYRTLDYATSAGAATPPKVGTGAVSFEIAGEIYPASFDSLKENTAGLGIAASFGYTLGLSIQVPGTNNSAPIKDGHVSVGARYRFVFGDSSIALGLGYWRRFYKADRAALMTPTQLDMPDADYAAVAPGVLARFMVMPKIAVFASVDVPLLLSAGPITDAMAGYGQGNATAFSINAGADYRLDRYYGLRLGFQYDQVGFKFGTNPRMVTNATDRTIGLVGTFALFY